MKTIISICLLLLLNVDLKSQNCKTKKVDIDPISNDVTILVPPNATADYLKEDTIIVANRVADLTFKLRKYTDTVYFYIIVNYRYQAISNFYYASNPQHQVIIRFSDGYMIHTNPIREFYDFKVNDNQKNNISFECRVSRNDIIHFTNQSNFKIQFEILEKKKYSTTQKEKDKQKSKSKKNNDTQLREGGTIKTFYFNNSFAGKKLSERAFCLLQNF